MTWESLFERASTVDVRVEDVRGTLARRREGTDDSGGADSGESDGSEPDPSPARIVADADVLAADLLVGGPAREALDHVRSHSWVTLVASDRIVDDAAAIVTRLGDADLASDWREQVTGLREPVPGTAGDHPALAAAYRGGAMHALTFDERLQTAAAGAAIRDRVETSLKTPAGFARLFDPESLYEAVEDGDYPGPDRDPRA